MRSAGDSPWKQDPERGGRATAGGLAVSALFFFPRGGSAQVTRSLARALPAAGWQVALAAGSLGGPGEPTHAASFFAGADLRPLDYSPTLARADPLRAPVPFPPSYEDRPDAPDRVFAAVDDAAYERLVAAWIEVLTRAGTDAADLLHLHHLTPVNEAAARAFPSLPVLGQLHGTELAMLRRIEAGAPPGWRYAQEWGRRTPPALRRCTRSCSPPPRACGSRGGGARDQPLSGTKNSRPAPKISASCSEDTSRPAARSIAGELAWQIAAASASAAWLGVGRRRSRRIAVAIRCT